MKEDIQQAVIYWCQNNEDDWDEEEIPDWIFNLIEYTQNQFNTQFDWSNYTWKDL